jgi:hypothetical protein
MSQRKRILIGCPHYQRYVTGSYPADAQGRYLLDRTGVFNPLQARCGRRGGRCSQVLCALHPYNRRANGTWYPTDLLAWRDGCTNAQKNSPQTRRSTG